MKEEDVLRVTRWIDGELKDSEVRDLLEDHPSIEEDRHAAMEIRQRIRQEMTSESDVPFPDLFNRQILKRIEDERRGTFRNRIHSFLPWLTISGWGLPLAASATLLGLLVTGIQLQRPQPVHSKVVHTFTPNPAHIAKTREIGKVRATLIDIEGLAPLPETDQVMGYFPTESREETLMAATTYFEDGSPRLLLSMSDLGEPRLQRLR